MEQKRLPVFAERFNSLRGERTQGEFADFLGISRPTVGFYENGTRIPDAITLRVIAEKCGVSSDWLLGLSDYMTQAQQIETNTLYAQLNSLMEREFDECDRKRVCRSLETTGAGFRAAISDYLLYTHYENAVLHTGIALTTVAECLDWVISISQEQLPPESKYDIYKKLYDIVHDASTTAYKELGTFFTRYLTAIRKVLGTNDYKSMYQGFADELETLKQEWGDIDGNHPETQ